MCTRLNQIFGFLMFHHLTSLLCLRTVWKNARWRKLDMAKCLLFANYYRESSSKNRTNLSFVYSSTQSPQPTSSPSSSTLAFHDYTLITFIANTLISTPTFLHLIMYSHLYRLHHLHSWLVIIILIVCSLPEILCQKVKESTESVILLVWAISYSTSDCQNRILLSIILA